MKSYDQDGEWPPPPADLSDVDQQTDTPHPSSKPLLTGTIIGDVIVGILGGSILFITLFFGLATISVTNSLSHINPSALLLGTLAFTTICVELGAWWSGKRFRYLGLAAMLAPAIAICLFAWLRMGLPG